MSTLPLNENGVSTLIEYMIISSIMVLLIIITVLTATPVIIEKPADQFSEYAFIDIGNGVSTRIVDLYVIAPIEGNISSKFDIPDDIVGREYFVEISADDTGDQINVYRGAINRKISLAGIGLTLRAKGATTGHGLNVIEYRSEGFL
jgi:hypothetical protein